MASISLKCHLCGTYLTQGPPIWAVGGREFREYQCLDRKCASLRVDKRCLVSVILPDNDIVGYQLLVSSNDKWYRFWAESKSECPSSTSISWLPNNFTDVAREEFIYNFSRYYPISCQDDLKVKSQEILDKFKVLLPFI